MCFTGQNLSPARAITKPDHHRYTPQDIPTDADSRARGIATTEKDAVKMRNLILVNAPDIWYLTIKLGFPDPNSEARFLEILRSGISPKEA